MEWFSTFSDSQKNSKTVASFPTTEHNGSRLCNSNSLKI